MKVEKLRKRKAKLLRDIVTKAGGRQDTKLPLSVVSSSLVVRGGGFADGDKSDQTKPISDLAYDLSRLREDGLIEVVYLSEKRGEGGGMIYSDPGIRVTAAGIERAVDEQKGWLRNAIEKQPMTFVQILVTLVIAILTFVGGWAVGRYLTPLPAQNQSEILAAPERLP